MVVGGAGGRQTTLTHTHLSVNKHAIQQRWGGVWGSAWQGAHTAIARRARWQTADNLQHHHPFSGMPVPFAPYQSTWQAFRDYK